MGTTVLIRIEKEEILTFAPNPAKTLDLTRRLPFIITESKIRRLIKTDSINKRISIAMIKQIKNLRFLKELKITMKLNATKKFIIFSKETTPSITFSATNNEIIDIMIQLESMLNSKEIVKKDDHRDEEYRKTLLSQDHNTSNGKTNKFINLPKKQLDDILKEKNILTFLEENFYF